MSRFSKGRSLDRWTGLASLMAFLFVIAACGGETATPTPTATSTLTPSQVTPTSTATPVGVNPTSTPTQTATPTVTAIRLTLELLSPQDGLGVEIGAVRVLGKPRVDPVLGINGVPAEVSVDGSFYKDITLDAAVTSIEVVAIDLSGETAFAQAVVFSISTTSGLPFTLFYPPDGIEVSQPAIQVMGGTRVDATVGVNGTPVEPNALGIFSTTVSLEQGINSIEIVATDLQGNIRFQNVVVFYTP